MLRFDVGAFRSRVGRRIFAFFVACSLVPVASFAVYSYVHVRQQLEADGLVALQRDAKSAGVSIFERLLISRAQLLSLDIGSAGKLNSTDDAATSAFLSIELRDPRSLDLTPKELSRLESPGHSSFRIAATAPPSFELLVSVDAGILLGALDPAPAEPPPVRCEIR